MEVRVMNRGFGIYALRILPILAVLLAPMRASADDSVYPRSCRDAYAVATAAMGNSQKVSVTRWDSRKLMIAYDEFGQCAARAQNAVDNGYALWGMIWVDMQLAYYYRVTASLAPNLTSMPLAQRKALFDSSKRLSLLFYRRARANIESANAQPAQLTEYALARIDKEYEYYKSDSAFIRLLTYQGAQKHLPATLKSQSSDASRPSQ